jgi:hypothetical protein
MNRTIYASVSIHLLRREYRAYFIQNERSVLSAQRHDALQLVTPASIRLD